MGIQFLTNHRYDPTRSFACFYSNSPPSNALFSPDTRLDVTNLQHFVGVLRCGVGPCLVIPKNHLFTLVACGYTPYASFGKDSESFRPVCEAVGGAGSIKRLSANKSIKNSNVSCTPPIFFYG
ncbi:hypothetical protein C8J57DRAFT_1232321 [Mycena rebaudengoi]|nr:hypothetical protein C8J57DRAFT_1232321 [Mycena rebaudengoi]